MMQIIVPEKNYWPDRQFPRFFIPKSIDDWLKAEGLHHEHCGSTSSGHWDNIEMIYVVREATSEQALLFKIHFPDCKIHHSNVESSNV